MTYNILPFVLIVVSLAIIIFLVIRKYPQLVLLDVDTIPGKKDEKRKTQYFKKRAEKKADEVKKNRFEKIIKPLIEKFKVLQDKFRDFVTYVKNEIHKHTQKQKNEAKKDLSEEDKKSVVESLIKNGSHALKEENYDLAEEKFIEAIRLAPKSEKAYRGLGDVYYKKDQYEGAKETYEFLAQLDPSDDSVLVKLAEISEKLGNIEDAVSYYQRAVLVNESVSTRFVKLADLLESIEEYKTALEAMQQAVDLEPKNPKYLDKLAELAIIVEDIELAEEVYDRFRMVNPDNEKLEVIKDKIEKKKRNLQEEN